MNARNKLSSLGGRLGLLLLDGGILPQPFRTVCPHASRGFGAGPAEGRVWRTLRGLGVLSSTIGAGAVAALVHRRLLEAPCHCQDGGGDREKKEEAEEHEDDDDDDEEGFDYNFAKPPVAPAALSWAFSHRVLPGEGGGRPSVEVTASSVFSLPVERGWARDTFAPADVADTMNDVLADRLVRAMAEDLGLELTGAPPPQRGLQKWPSAARGDAPVLLRWQGALPGPPPLLPPVLTVRRLEAEAGTVRFELGGWACAKAPGATLSVTCEPIGCQMCPEEGEEESERLDIRLRTSLHGLPAAGRLWGLLGCGGRWWFEAVRLPIIRGTLERFHAMAHEQMMLCYVAALKG